jgi:hypothetical protein
MSYPFILGILTKVYDDSVDINLFPEITPYLQSLIVLFFALTAQNQFFFVFPCILVTALNNGFDNPFWKSLLPVSILLSMIYFPWGERLLFLKIVLSVLAVLMILAIAVVEEILFPEEWSKRKIIFRSILGILLAGGLAVYSTIAPLVLPRYAIEPLRIACYIQIGFTLMSVLTMSYMMYQDDTPPQKKLKESNPPSESTTRDNKTMQADATLAEKMRKEEEDGTDNIMFGYAVKGEDGRLKFVIRHEDAHKFKDHPMLELEHPPSTTEAQATEATEATEAEATA